MSPPRHRPPADSTKSALSAETSGAGPAETSAAEFNVTIHGQWSKIEAQEWDGLLARQALPTPFLRHAYLAAMQASGSATPETGWTVLIFCLRQGDVLLAACALYAKPHSYGEYVFDWAWANAYAEHGLDYYPKAVIAPPFTPVPGSRLLAVNDDARLLLLRAVLQWCEENHLSSLHLLFSAPADVAAAEQAGLLLRQTVQFHWTNAGYRSFDDFLQRLSQDKRKKIRQERRRVQDAGVTFRHRQGRAISASDWDFFYRCYERTYLEHGNAPYLTRDFFQHMADGMPEHWLMFIAEQNGRDIACSLIALGTDPASASGQNDSNSFADGEPINVAYGRYWGALERVDCLHFEACYYQPLAWCIANQVLRFEGGAQGEHKMARALLPVATTSAHWLAHPAFADAVERYLARETQGITQYVTELQAHSPFKLQSAETPVLPAP